MAAGYGPPRIDFGQLGDIGTAYTSAYDAARKRALQDQQQAALSDLGKTLASGGTPDYMAAGARLMATNPELGLSLFKMGQDELDRQNVNKILTRSGAGGATTLGGLSQSGEAAPPKLAGQDLVDQGRLNTATLKSLDIHPMVAAGMTGNFGWESGGFNPQAIGDAGRSFGYGQWNADRLKALQTFAATNGLNVNDPTTQLAFGANEIKTKYPQVYAAAAAAGSPQEAARIISQGYEIPDPAKANVPQRQAYATAFAQPGPLVATNEAQVQQAEEALGQRPSTLPGAVSGLFTPQRMSAPDVTATGGIAAQPPQQVAAAAPQAPQPQQTQQQQQGAVITSPFGNFTPAEAAALATSRSSVGQTIGKFLIEKGQGQWTDPIPDANGNLVSRNTMTNETKILQAADPAIRKWQAIVQQNPNMTEQQKNDAFMKVMGATAPSDTLEQQIAARAKAAADQGLKPGTPAYQSYVLAGKFEDTGKMSPIEEKQFEKNDTALNHMRQGLDDLKRLSELNPQIPGGFTGPLKQVAARITGGAAYGQEAALLAEYKKKSLLHSMELANTLVGGKVTNYQERTGQQLQPDSGMSPPERQAIIDDQIKMTTQAIADLERQQARLQSPSSGRKDVGGAPVGAPSAAGAFPIPAAAVNDLKSMPDTPQTRALFDKTFRTPGAADKILGPPQ